VPLRVDIDAYFPYPKSMSKKNRELTRYHINKPDKDNLEKLVLDALNGVIYKDDSCVCSGLTQKFYSETPRIEIRIRRLDEPHTNTKT
jgi:Holliday junction resolvase RusA-like endonuclease